MIFSTFLITIGFSVFQNNDFLIGDAGHQHDWLMIHQPYRRVSLFSGSIGCVLCRKTKWGERTHEAGWSPECPWFCYIQMSSCVAVFFCGKRYPFNCSCTQTVWVHITWILGIASTESHQHQLTYMFQQSS